MTGRILRIFILKKALMSQPSRGVAKNNYLGGQVLVEIY